MQERYDRKEADGYVIWRRCKEVRRIGEIGRKVMVLEREKTLRKTLRVTSQLPF